MTNRRLTNRRQLIGSGLAVAGASLSPVAGWAASAGRREAVSRPPILLERVVFDGRFPEAAAAAREAAAGGAPAVRIGGDLTSLWYDDLDLAWKRAPMALAGITTEQGLFVLETLAADRGMRVVYRGRHGLAADGRTVHSLTGPADMLASLAGLAGGARLTSDRFWPRLGRAMTRCPMTRDVAAIEIAARGSKGSRRAESLYSWVIAPRSPGARPV